MQISLLDRQELQQRVKLFCLTRGHPEHWLYTGMFKRVELQKALGNHLSWKDRYIPLKQWVTIFFAVIHHLYLSQRLINSFLKIENMELQTKLLCYLMEICKYSSCGWRHKKRMRQIIKDWLIAKTRELLRQVKKT